MYLLYFLLWVIFNGNFTLEICLFGIVIAAVIFAFTCKFMDYSVQKEIKNIKKFFSFLHYVGVLVFEIIKANLTVVHIILSEEEEIQPVMVTFQSDLKTPTGRALLANAITLTPGTITATLEGPVYTVHCLDESLSEGIDELVFEKMIKDLEKE